MSYSYFQSSGPPPLGGGPMYGPPEHPRDRVSRWGLANVLDNAITGVRQGMLIDNLLFEDPEVKASTDLPIVRMTALLGSAILEGAFAQSWVLRGLQAVAKGSRIPKVARAAAQGMESMLGSDDIVNRVAGSIMLGASTEATLNILGGREWEDVMSATGFAAIGAGAVGAGGAAMLARRGMARTLPPAEQKMLSLGGDKLRSIINEQFRYEHAMRAFPSFEDGVPELNHADDYRALKGHRVVKAHEQITRLRQSVATPLAEGDVPRNYETFTAMISASHDAAKARLGMRDAPALSRSLQALEDARNAATPQAKLAFAEHEKLLKEIADHAKSRIGAESPDNLSLFEGIGIEDADDFLYAMHLADKEALFDSGKHFRIQLLRRGSFIDRKPGRKEAESYYEMMHRAMQRVAHDKLMDEFIERTSSKLGVKLTPEQQRAAIRDKRIVLEDGTDVVPFFKKDAHLYPTYAVTQAQLDYMRKGAQEAAKVGEEGFEDVFAVSAHRDVVFLPEPVANRLTEEILGKKLFDERTGIGGAVRKATAYWKYNTIWWGLSRFFGMQLIGDTLNTVRSNPAVFRGGRQSPAARALQEIFRHYKAPMASREQGVGAAIGAAVGVGAGMVVEDDHWLNGPQAIAAALAGAGVGYAARTVRAAGTVQTMRQAYAAHKASPAAAAGMPYDFSVHVPPMKGQMPEALANTAVKHPTTGQPTIVFHGTASVFVKFDESFVASNNHYGRGFYFTEDPELATQYAEAGGQGARGAGYTDAQISLMAEDPVLRQIETELRGLGQNTERYRELTQARSDRIIELSGKFPNVRMHRLRIEKPFDVDGLYELGSPEVQGLLARIRQQGSMKAAMAEDRIMREAKIREIAEDGTEKIFLSGDDIFRYADSYLTIALPGGAVSGKEFVRDILEPLGYDGLTHMGGKIMGETPHRVWISWRSDQIFDVWDEIEEPMMARFASRDQIATAAARTQASASFKRPMPAPAAAPSMYELAEQYHVIGSGFVAQEMELNRRIMGSSGTGLTMPATSKQQKARDSVLSLLAGKVHGDPARGVAKILDTVETIQQERENWLRLASFMQQLEDGVDPRVASKRARESLVDYGRFTDFEDKYLRGALLPFYAFTRANTANWAKTLVGKDVGGKPAVALMAAGAIASVDVAAQAWNQMFFGDVEAKLPEWQREGFHLILGNPLTGEALLDKNGRAMVVATELGFEATLELLGLARPASVLNAFGAGIPKEQSILERALHIQDVDSSPLHVREALGGLADVAVRLLSPAARGPLELAGNTSWLYDAPIVPEEYRGTPEAWAIRMDHVGSEVFRQYREWSRVERDSERGLWNPVNSAFGLGLPVNMVDLDAGVRRRLHTLMAHAQTEQRIWDARWRKPIDELIYGRPRWDQPREEEPQVLSDILARFASDPEDRERATRYYVERTAKSSVQRHWNTMNGLERTQFLKSVKPGDLEALTFYVNGGESLAKYAEGVER